jgi:hypothetical protein
MHKTILLLTFILSFSYAAHSQLPAWELPKPAGWGSETFGLPPAFAPQIVFKGTEEIRFAPGWSNSGSEDYWSYAFIWLVEGKQTLSGNKLADYIIAYYNGLYMTNLKEWPAPNPGFTKVSFHRLASTGRDGEAYEGVVNTLNFLNHRQLSLNVTVRLRELSAAKATLITFEVSPKTSSHPVWKQLATIVSGFKLK